MGLGAPRKRTKISHDPNNTTWSRSTNSYGQKMLRSQGWTPGSLLGAINAPHAHLHSDANASHIRISVKDNNLGIGAKRGSAQDSGECTGLDSLQSLLGRLNGKSEGVLMKEQKTRDDLKRAAYATRKFGALRFVTGGVLVGDRVVETIEEQRVRSADQVSLLLSQGMSTVLQNGQDRSLNHGQREPLRTAFVMSAGPTESEALAAEPARQDLESENLEQRSEKEIRKAAKAQRKLDRRKRRNARNVLPQDKHELSAPLNHDACQEKVRIVDIPATPIPPAVITFGGRHAVRQRYIQQKKLAMMDPKALNEILMVKG